MVQARACIDREARENPRENVGRTGKGSRTYDRTTEDRRNEESRFRNRKLFAGLVDEDGATRHRI
jgi:hypothetical protein